MGRAVESSKFNPESSSGQNSKLNLMENIKDILEFYHALGFERLPIKLKVKSQQSEVSTYPLTLPPRGGKQRWREGSELKAAALKALRDEIGDCKRCKLSKGRTTIVFGEGNPDARLMFIGEAPGREEDLQARPFVGDAGMLLTRLIEKMGFKRGDVYITNIVKCRPPMNRDPYDDEIERCRSFVEKEIEIINPEVIMCLGRISAQILIGYKGVKMTTIRGNFFDYKGIPIMPTFHPAYLLRNPKDKWLTWGDAQKLLEKLKAR